MLWQRSVLPFISSGTPMLCRTIPIIASEKVERDFGSGVLKITPGHDPTDFEIGQSAGLPTINLLNDDGSLNANAGKYEGLKRKKAQAAIWADLEVSLVLHVALYALYVRAMKLLNDNCSLHANAGMYEGLKRKEAQAAIWASLEVSLYLMLLSAHSQPTKLLKDSLNTDAGKYMGLKRKEAQAASWAHSEQVSAYKSSGGLSCSCKDLCRLQHTAFSWHKHAAQSKLPYAHIWPTLTGNLSASVQAAGLAIRTQAHTMRVPRSQRGGDIVEPLVRDQWFVKAKPLAEPALQASPSPCLLVTALHAIQLASPAGRYACLFLHVLDR